MPSSSLLFKKKTKTYDKIYPFEVYSSAVFHRVTQPCNHHCWLIPEHSCHPQRNSMLVLSPGKPLMYFPPLWLWLHLLSKESCLCGPGVWLHSLSITFSRFVFIVACITALFLLSQVIEMPPRGYSFINWWRFGWFLFLFLWIMLLRTIVHEILCGRVFPFLSGLELGIEELGPRVTLCLICWGTANRLSKELAPF